MLPNITIKHSNNNGDTRSQFGYTTMPKLTNVKNTNFIILVVSVSCFIALIGRLFHDIPVSIIRCIFLLVLGSLLLQGTNKWVVLSIFIASLIGQFMGHWDWIKSYQGMSQLTPIIAFIPVGYGIWKEIISAKHPSK